MAGIQRGGGAEMRVHANAGKSELDHMGAADDGCACRAQAGNGRGVCSGEGRILQNQGAGGTARALRVEQILDRDGQASQGRSGWRFCSSPACLVKKSLAENVGAQGALRGSNAHLHEVCSALAAFADLKSDVTEVELHGSVLKFCGFAKG